MQKQNVILSSTEPITDGGRKYNCLYVIGAVIGFIAGMFLGNAAGGVFGAFLGMIIALCIKNMICDHMDRVLRNMTFACPRKVPYEQLIQQLQPRLFPLNMTIERGKGGEPVISYKGLIYDVAYKEDSTFAIWWRQSLVKALITNNEYISVYRKASVAYGIIAYHVQQICSGTPEGCQNSLVYANGAPVAEGTVACPACGAACKADARFCIKCGTSLEKAIGAGAKCPKCGNPITAGDKFCVKCGSQL